MNKPTRFEGIVPPHKAPPNFQPMARQMPVINTQPKNLQQNQFSMTPPNFAPSQQPWIHHHPGPNLNQQNSHQNIPQRLPPPGIRSWNTPNLPGRPRFGPNSQFQGNQTPDFNQPTFSGRQNPHIPADKNNIFPQNTFPTLLSQERLPLNQQHMPVPQFDQLATRNTKPIPIRTPNFRFEGSNAQYMNQNIFPNTSNKNNLPHFIRPENNEPFRPIRPPFNQPRFNNRFIPPLSNLQQSPHFERHPLQNSRFPINQTHPVNQQPLNVVEQNHSDVIKNMVQKWLKSRNLSGKFKADDCMKLYEYKKIMSEYVTKLERLRQLNDTLAENMDNEQEKWDTLVNDSSTLKNELLKMQQQLFHPKQVNNIAKQIKDRKKKRERIKRKKQADSERYFQSLGKRIKLNEKIDEWQQKEQKKILMEKMEENLKNEAGESLLEVKRKQYEAREYIKSFHYLKQLRDVRKQTAIYKGILVTEKDNTSFNSKVDDVIDLLTKQKKIYEDEERALRVLREEEAEELNRVELEKRKKLKKLRQQDLNKVDPMFTYRSYWLQSEENIQSFVHIRGLWDMYLCQPDFPGASRIPDDWVEPSLTSNPEWEKYLVVKKLRKRKSEIGAEN